jgi:hypothetical protein
LAVAVDLLSGLEDDGVLRDTAARLNEEVVPKTSPMVTAQIARLEALLAIRGGDPALAGARWATAIETLSDAGIAFDAAALSLERFEQLPEHPGALSGLHRAINTFTGVRAAPWLERARRAAGPVGDRLVS